MGKTLMGGAASFEFVFFFSWLFRIYREEGIHHRDAEFAEIRVFIDQQFSTLRPPRLRGEPSYRSPKTLDFKR
jgi:hypothetical protein